MGITKIIAILIGVLVTIIGLAFLGSYANSVFSGTKVAQASSELSTVIDNVQGLYASQPDFSGLTNTVAIQGGVYPSNMATQTSAQATDPWGGTVTVESPAGTPTEFTVEFDNIPQDSCTKIGLSYTSSNLESLTINGNAVSPITPAAMTVACAGTSAPISMIWTLN